MLYEDFWKGDDYLNTKEEVLKALLTQPEQYISGQELADKLQVSRHAVWKAIDKLRKEGLEIEARTNLGYRVLQTTQPFGIHQLMSQLTHPERYQIAFHESIDSTNNHAKVLAEAGADAWTVVIADKQTAGRGRMGRQFHSPEATGLYMSIILRPTCQAQEANLLTIAAAAAVCEGLQDVFAVEAQIKWVNDCFVNGRKVAGILTEGAIGLEEQKLRYAVVGIGINIAPPKEGFPEDLESIAGAVVSHQVEDVERSRLANAILERFYDYAENLLQRTYFEVYRERLMMLSRNVILIQGKQKEKVFVMDLELDGSLTVRQEDGKIKRVNSGEVSLRLEDRNGGELS